MLSSSIFTFQKQINNNNMSFLGLSGTDIILDVYAIKSFLKAYQHVYIQCMSVKIQHHWENVSYSFWELQLLWQFLCCWQSAVLTKGNFLKNRRCGGLMKHELEGSIGKISVSVSSWETPGGSDKRGGMRLSLFFSPVRPFYCTFGSFL